MSRYSNQPLFVVEGLFNALSECVSEVFFHSSRELLHIRIFVRTVHRSTSCRKINKLQVGPFKKRVLVGVRRDHSCSRPRFESPACGTCDACAFRLKAFQELGERDQIDYEERPEYAD
jgi:7-cyano-7-deazaguanine synthase in queuosine biosynthesis